MPDEKMFADEVAASLKTYLNTAAVVHQGKEALESTFKALHGPAHPRHLDARRFLRDQLFDNLPMTPQARRAWTALNGERLFGADRARSRFIPQPLLRCGLAVWQRQQSL